MNIVLVKWTIKMSMEGDRVGVVQMSPPSCWTGLSVFRLGMDDPSARLRQSGQALLAAACSAKRSRRTRFAALAGG